MKWDDVVYFELSSTSRANNHGQKSMGTHMRDLSPTKSFSDVFIVMRQLVVHVCPSVKKHDDGD